MKKLSPSEVNNFLVECFYAKVARIGQAFCNRYNVTDPDLFYECDKKAAIQRIWEKYVAGS